MEKYTFPKEQRDCLEKLRQPFAVYQFLENRVVPLVLSDGFCALFGFGDRSQAYEAIADGTHTAIHPDDAARVAAAERHFIGNGGRYEIIFRCRRRGSAEYNVIHAIGERVTAGAGVPLAQIWYTDEGEYRDGAASDLNRAMNNALHEESILKANRYDCLTGLPSMTYFFELAEVGRRALLEEGGLPALLFIDLCGMKYYNHKYSFAEGDRLLQSFAGLISRLFRPENCCHIGADHFAVFADENGLEEKLRALFDEWREMDAVRHLPVCVGIYPNRVEVVPVSSAYDRAKIACDALKGTYTSSFNYYRQELRDGIVRQQNILENFDRALSEGWIQVYYQPIIRSVNGEVCDEEALARWVDPERGVLPPSEFIPYLEEAGLIYRLDLYVLEQILRDIRTREAEGLYIVPHSVNLSRSDFDVCDMVEEIRRRVDEAGVSRDKISIELTESVVGSDFDFIRTQVRRFQDLGFAVWMDDFGSGYSSLDALQSIKFDLIKFDMGFMRKLDESEDGRVILSELIKMAIALDVDTICEGVETPEQVRFLQENGCAKLQGYYFSKPVPLSQALVWHREHRRDGYENPAESTYYESIGRVNLYDLSVIASSEESDAIHNAFNMIPMGIIEVRGDSARFMRSNRSYREFIHRFFGINLSREGSDFAKFSDGFMRNVVRTCCEQGIRAFYDEKMPDGSVVHSFARRIGENPVTGCIAVAVAVLSVTPPSEGATYVEIARALAADYYNIYVVDLETERFIEYSSAVGVQDMAVERHGEDFFESTRLAAHRIYEEDRESFFAAFSREKLLLALDEQGVFTMTYRLVDTGVPVYVNMKVTRLQPGGSKIIMGISIIDAQVRQEERREELQRERATMVRVMALSDGYLALYTVDPETGRFVEFTSSDDFALLDTPREGEDFFRQMLEDAPKYLAPGELPAFSARFSRERILRTLREQGSWSLQYRILMNGEPRPVILRISPFVEGGETRLLAGVRTWRERK